MLKTNSIIQFFSTQVVPKYVTEKNFKFEFQHLSTLVDFLIIDYLFYVSKVARI